MSQLWSPIDRHPSLRLLLLDLRPPCLPDLPRQPRVRSSRSISPLARSMTSPSLLTPTHLLRKAPMAVRPVPDRIPREEEHRHVSIPLPVLPRSLPPSNTSSNSNRLWPWQPQYSQRLPSGGVLAKGPRNQTMHHPSSLRNHNRRLNRFSHSNRIPRTFHYHRNKLVLAQRPGHVKGLGRARDLILWPSSMLSAQMPILGRDIVTSARSVRALLVVFSWPMKIVPTNA